MAGNRGPVGQEEIMDILPHHPPGMTVEEIIAELGARNARRKWGRTGPEYFTRRALQELRRAGRAEPVGKDGKWQAWIAKTTA